MTNWTKRLVLAGAALALVGAAGIGAAFAQADAIKARQALYKNNGAAMQAIKAVVDAKGPTEPVAAEAAKLINTFKNVMAHYPAGSDAGETKASPDIWKNMADFQALNANALTAATKLEADAKKGDVAVVATDFGDMGKACGACHNKYRLK
jgi:cytochrome c556